MRKDKRKKCPGKPLKIGNKTWMVRLVYETLQYDNSAWDYGVVRFKQQEILINSACTKDAVIETFFHELFHVFIMVATGTRDEKNGKIGIELAANLVGEGMATLIYGKQLMAVLDYLTDDFERSR